MIPQNTMSSIAINGPWLAPDDRGTSLLVDYERGGVALLDSSQGLMGYNWTCFVEGSDVSVQRDGQPPILLFSAVGITELVFTFDQNMRYCVAYMQDDVLKMRWFDSYAGGFVVTSFPGAFNPKLALDDKRSESLNTSDMILAYIRGSTIYWRQQRDRFTIEYVAREDLPSGMRMRTIGMSKNLRFQIELL